MQIYSLKIIDQIKTTYFSWYSTAQYSYCSGQCSLRHSSSTGIH